MIYMMRHGQDDERFIGGWSDVGLVPEGVKEVEEAAIWIKDNLQIKQILSSDITRARQTAYLVSSYLGVPVIYTRDLREQNKGIINGMDGKMALERYPHLVDGVQIDTVYPNGESIVDLYERIKIYLKIILEMDDTLLITHRGVINMIYYIFNNIQLDMDKARFNVIPASIHEIDKENRLIRKVR